jgi:hypothetical protein
MRWQKRKLDSWEVLHKGSRYRFYTNGDLTFSIMLPRPNKRRLEKFLVGIKTSANDVSHRLTAFSGAPITAST